MESQIQVKYDVMINYANQLNQLASEINTNYSEMPETDGLGMVADQIAAIRDTVISLRAAIGTLVETSSKFVVNTAELFKTSDKLILDPEIGKVTTYENYRKDVIQQWNSRIGKTLADIDNPAYKDTGSKKGQCVWYAIGRFNELTNIKVYCANGGQMLDRNRNNPNVQIIDGKDSIDQIEVPAIAVDNHGQYGHVLVIEKVIRDANGHVTDVYITECNWRSSNGQYDPGQDAVVERMSIAQFKKRSTIGYIIPKK